MIWVEFSIAYLSLLTQTLIMVLTLLQSNNTDTFVFYYKVISVSLKVVLTLTFIQPRSLRIICTFIRG